MDPRDLTTTYEIQSARSPGWFQVDCDLCDWHTTGREDVTDDAAWEHVTDNHPRRLART